MGTFCIAKDPGSNGPLLKLSNLHIFFTNKILVIIFSGKQRGCHFPFFYSILQCGYASRPFAHL